MAGEESLLLKVRAESMPALEHLVWEIRALDSVERTKTMIVLGTAFEGRPVVPATPESADLSEAPPAAHRDRVRTRPSPRGRASSRRPASRSGSPPRSRRSRPQNRASMCASGEHGHRHGVRLARRCGREPAVAGREAEHRVAARVLAAAAASRDAEARPAGRAGRTGAGSSGASVARSTMIEPASGGDRRRRRVAAGSRPAARPPARRSRAAARGGRGWPARARRRCAAVSRRARARPCRCRP